MWARFRQLVYEMSFTNVGKVLPVLVSEADKCGRGFAILLWNELHKRMRHCTIKVFIVFIWTSLLDWHIKYHNFFSAHITNSSVEIIWEMLNTPEVVSPVSINISKRISLN